MPIATLKDFEIKNIEEDYYSSYQPYKRLTMYVYQDETADS